MPKAQQSDVEAYTVLDGKRASHVAQSAFLLAAEQKVRDWIGDQAYDDVSGGDDETKVKAAEALLATQEALPTMNLMVQDGFGIIREKGFEQQRVQLMSRSELAAYRGDLVETAKGILGDLGDLGDIDGDRDEDTVYVL